MRNLVENAEIENLKHQLEEAQNWNEYKYDFSLDVKNKIAREVELQKKQIHTPENDHELDHLKSMLQEANNREITLTNYLKENEKHDEEIDMQVTFLNRELEESKIIEETLRSQIK